MRLPSVHTEGHSWESYLDSPFRAWNAAVDAAPLPPLQHQLHWCAAGPHCHSAPPLPPYSWPAPLRVTRGTGGNVNNECLHAWRLAHQLWASTQVSRLQSSGPVCRSAHNFLKKKKSRADEEQGKHKDKGT